MPQVPAMTREEVEELIQDLSTNVGLSTALADDMLDAGHVIMWATKEADLDEEEAQQELSDVVHNLEGWIQDELEDNRDVEMVLLGLWAHIQELERQLREAPGEADDEATHHDRMFN